MGTITAQAIITNVSLVLQDTTNVQWPGSELMAWLNDGQRQVVLAKPDAYSTIANMTSVAGSRQSIPSTWNRLIDVYRNMGADGATPGRAITRTNRRPLDLQTPNWHAMAPAADAIHYIFDPRTPQTFYTYPPMVAGRKLELAGSVSPPPVAALSDTIALDDVYAPVLHDYILYRAYTKDNGDAQLQRAALHIKAFQDALNAKGATDASIDVAQQPALGQ